MNARRSLLCFAAVLIITPLGVAEERLPRQWKSARVIKAPEAFQAAAADAKWVFAISSRVVGKYDRTTGKRVAASHGEASHLNSGFLWKGQLLCAHSNYPSKPEKSSIKSLDIRSMRLKTWKDLGDPGGSLTWVLRHDKRWWCNFAHYGSENSKTFLVEYDDQWKEQRRFSYPPVVVSKLGKYSLSGGIWYGNSLLVTGHDDPVVFQLRLPKRGTELVYKGTHQVPFSGQGFARDPKTSHLVGIVRSRREIHFAVPR